jgi:hypothetical protein
MTRGVINETGHRMSKHPEAAEEKKHE